MKNNESVQGFGRFLVFVYAIFAVSAGARAFYQIFTDFSAAPLAYVLSAFAAVVYLCAAIFLAKAGSVFWLKMAFLACIVELFGVLFVGFFSVIFPDIFPKSTVWSFFGQGYGFVPLFLPIVGLVWLRRNFYVK